MNVERSIVINAPVDQVWEHAAGRFDRIGEWSSYVASSRPVAKPTRPHVQMAAAPVLSLGEAPMGGRACATGQGETHETFIAFDAVNRTFTYEVAGGPMPSFIARATNTWRIEPVEATRTRLSMSADMTIGTWWGHLVALPMSFGMGRVLRHNLEEFKHFLETGSPHPRKEAARRRGPRVLEAR